MATFTEQISGLGLDGYLRVQKEDTYGTDKTDGMTDLKILPETDIIVDNQSIEVNNQVASRIRQDDDKLGRVVVSGTLELEQDPTTIGLVMDAILDQKAVTGDAATGYTHAYYPTMTGQTSYNSLTVQQAKGSNLADQYSGVVGTGFTISSDNEGAQKLSVPIVGQGHTADVERQTSWTYGAVSPFNFAMTTVTLEFDGYDATAKCVDSYEFTVDLAYNTEDFKLCSREIQAPTYNAITTGSLNMTIDADATLIEFARAQTNCKIILTTTHATLAGSSSGEYQHIIEIPKMRLATATTIANANEKLKLELAFDKLYGGTTTNSGAVEVPFEIRVVDATATYA